MSLPTSTLNHNGADEDDGALMDRTNLAVDGGDHQEDFDDSNNDVDLTDVSIGACIESSCLSPEPRLYTFILKLSLHHHHPPAPF